MFYLRADVQNKDFVISRVYINLFGTEDPVWLSLINPNSRTYKLKDDVVKAF